MTAIYILNLALIAAIIYRAWLYARSSAIHLYFLPALCCKLTCGILLGVLYYYYYSGGDTIAYYESAVYLTQLPWTSFYSTITDEVLSSDPVRAIYFTRFIAWVIWMTQADYWILSIYLSLFSFLCAFFVASEIGRWHTKLRLSAIVAFLFCPTVVFWTAGVLKESLAFGCFSFIVGAYVKYSNEKYITKSTTVAVLMAIVGLVTLKYYVAAPLLPLLLYLVIYYWLHQHSILAVGFWWRSTLILVALILPAISLFSWISPNLTWSHIWQVMHHNHEVLVHLSPDRAIHSLHRLGAFEIVVNIPYYIFSGLFRPFIGEYCTFPIVLATFENFLLFGFAIGALMLIKNNKPIAKPEILATVIYLIVLAPCISYSAPNFGTLTRYKVYYLPLFILFLTVPIRLCLQYITAFCTKKC